MTEAFRLLFALFCVWLLGASVLSLLNLRTRRPPLQYAQPGIDFAVGAAALGLLWVVSALIGRGLSAPLTLCVVALSAVAAGIRTVGRRHVAPPRVPRPPLQKGHVALTAVIGLALLLAVVGTVRISLLEPPFWDGRYIWAFKSKALFVDGRVDRETFSSLPRYRYTAVDHPLTVPALQAWVYQVLGRVEERQGKLVGLVCWLGMGALLTCCLRRRLPWPWALAVGGLALQTPLLAYYARSGGADVEQGFHLLAAGVLMTEWQETRRREEGVLAALLLGTGALVKPEGLSMMLGGAALFALLAVRMRPRPRLAELALIATALVGPVLPWLALRLSWQIPSPMLRNMYLRPWAELGPRLATIAEQVLHQMRPWQHWELAWVVVAIGLVAQLGLRPRPRQAAVMWLLVCWQFLVDLAVYALNPYAIRWTLNASLDRLLLQLLPLALLAACVSLLCESSSPADPRSEPAPAVR